MTAENRKREADKAGPIAGIERPHKDYGRATPGEIISDIEQTRAHMDETLSLLGRKMTPGRGGKAVLSMVGGSLLALAGFAGFLLVRQSHGGRLVRHALKAARHVRPRAPWLMRTPGYLEQALLVGKLVMSARRAKPSIIVVEPRKT